MAKRSKFKIGKNTWLILGGVAAVVGVIAWPIYQMSRKIYLASIRAKIRQVTAWGANVQLSLNIKNGSTADLPIDAVVGEVYYGDYVLASVSTAQRFVIESGQVTEVLTDVMLNWQNLGSNVVSIIKSGDLLQSIVFKGKITVQGISIPIRQKIKVL